MESATDINIRKFEELSSKYFAFLENEYHFTKSTFKPSVNISSILYESNGVYVIVDYGPPSYEPELSLGRSEIDEKPKNFSFHPSDLIELKECSNWEWNNSYADKLENWISELARLLKTCGEKCLINDTATFDEMAFRKKKRLNDWLIMEKTRNVKQNLELSWKRKDYSAYIELYKNLLYPGDIEKKRFDYSVSRTTG